MNLNDSLIITSINIAENVVSKDHNINLFIFEEISLVYLINISIENNILIN
jgi:hypothetical protein